MYRKLAPLALAIVLTLSVTVPVFAGTPYPDRLLWVTRAASNGYDFEVPVCLGGNFDDPDTGGWNLNTNRMARADDAIQEFNRDNVDGRYYLSSQDCSYFASRNLPHLRIRWADYDEGYGMLGVTESYRTDDFCITHCVYGFSIDIQPSEYLDQPPDLVIGEPWWYKGDSTDVPSGDPDLGEAILHELGHASGLDHTSVLLAQMCAQPPATSECAIHDWVWGPGPANRIFSIDDVTTLRSIWGTHT